MNSGLPSGALAGCSRATVSIWAASQAAMKARAPRGMSMDNRGFGFGTHHP